MAKKQGSKPAKMPKGKSQWGSKRNTGSAGGDEKQLINTGWDLEKINRRDR